MLKNSDTSYLPYDYAKLLKVGCDVDWCKTSPGRKYYHKAKRDGLSVPKMFYEKGFRHVRIRVADHVAPKSGAIMNESTGLTLLQEIDVVVHDCLEAGLFPIIAYQAAEFKHDPTNNGNVRSVVRWWNAIAKNFSGISKKVAFNFIIETTGKILKDRDDRLNYLYAEVAKKIRPYDDKRLFIIGANKISAPERLTDLVIPTKADGGVDEYILAECHWQAAGPQRDNSRKQWDKDRDGYGDDYEKGLIDAKIKAATDWRSSTGRYTWVGAIMCNNYNLLQGNNAVVFEEDGSPKGGDYPEPKDQIEFAKYTSTQLGRAGIPVSYNSDTKFFDRVNVKWFTKPEIVIRALIDEYENNYQAPPKRVPKI